MGECLFHSERLSYDNSLDSGHKSFQCGRVADIFKLWTYFKGNGLKGVEEQMELKFNLTNFFKSFLEKNKERYIIAIKESEMFNVCFWYVPK